METRIPFSGFYESLHSAEIDRAEEFLIQDASGDPIEGLGRIWEEVDTRKVQLAYAQNYVASFQQYFKRETGLDIKLKYVEMTSPREYNFQTDRIFAQIAKADVRRLWAKVDKERLDRRIAETFTSCSGFISYYPNTLAAWLDKNSKTGLLGERQGGPVTTWDHNQLCTLIEAVLEPEIEGKYDWEFEVIEDWSGNGVVEDMVYEALSKEGKRITRVASYLRSREERRYAAA